MPPKPDAPNSPFPGAEPERAEETNSDVPPLSKVVENDEEVSEDLNDPRKWETANQALFYIDKTHLNSSHAQVTDALNYIGHDFLKEISETIETSNLKSLLFLDNDQMLFIETIEIKSRVFFFFGKNIGNYQDITQNQLFKEYFGRFCKISNSDTKNKWYFFDELCINQPDIEHITDFIIGREPIRKLTKFLNGTFEKTSEATTARSHEELDSAHKVARPTAPLDITESDIAPKFKAAAEKKALGKTLLALRMKANMSLAKVAKAMGTGSRAVHRMERGEVNPSVEVVQRYAKAVGHNAEIVFTPNDNS